MSSSVIPCIRYRDAPRMIEWLCRTFGFERNMVVDDGNHGIAHAQLGLGPGMIMLGTLRDDAFGQVQGGSEGRKATQSAYIVVADADEIYSRVVAHGGEIVIEIKDEDYGGRGFCCRDPEGQVWSIGTYDPWKTGH